MQANENLLSVPDLAKYMGVPVSRIYNMVFYRKIPFYKIGRTVRFKMQEIQRYLAGVEILPTSDNNNFVGSGER
ncbi:MAG: helix-turn-helix domain-containing protein [Fibrobacteres bacterium]|nr:helix-turn-helix domain-containing protein [Fibrobacterota bacterium]